MLCTKKSKANNKAKKIILIAVLLLCAVIILFEMQAIPFTRKCVKKQSKTISSNIIADKIEEVQSDMNFEYSDLAVIKYSDSGEVRSISENTVNVNKLKAKIAKEIQNELDKQTVYSFKLPLGSFTDVTAFSTFGPCIDISFILTGSVNCKLKSTFESGGVNQTVHHIKLIVTTDIITISPEYSEHNTYKTDYEIAQTVIVGQTPSTFADIVR